MQNDINSPCATEDAATAEIKSPSAADLLETVKGYRADAGDGLTDEEFTFFLQRKHLPAEAGFSFVCFHNACVTLAVPPQQDKAWHPGAGWISPAKEKIAASIAQRHRFMLSEPPDAALKFLVPEGWAIRHHLEFSNRRETLIIAHPEFLKIRLYASNKSLVFPPSPGLLEELAALYQTEV